MIYDQFIEKHTWTFAKTMPQWPHWYIIRNDSNSDQFAKFVTYIRENSKPRIWEGVEYLYLDMPPYTYWTIGNPVEETKIINRAKINAP